MTPVSYDDLTIRVMDRMALDQAIEWAAAEGWNPGLNDADCFHTADPTGFLMGYLGDEPIASISVVRYSSAFGFLGFYIVRPDQRGRGFGFRLWQAGMEYLEGCTVGLDGVVASRGTMPDPASCWRIAMSAMAEVCGSRLPTMNA